MNKPGLKLAALALSSVLAFLPPPALAFGNGSSFTNAAESTIDYSYAPARPLRDCGAMLRAATDNNVSIISAKPVMADAGVAAHCRVHGIIAPEIQFVVHLPEQWNRRLFIHGNGNDGGESVHGHYGRDIRNTAVRHGFVASFSNMGHDRASFKGSSWAHNNLQRELDFSYRALHLHTRVVKDLIESYYGRRPAYSYFDGCSTGGGQGLKAAQRFPDDFDGIVAGAPVSDPAKLLLYFWNINMAQETMQLSDARLEKLGNFIIKKYDRVDGVKDGVISNPAAIDFQPERDLPRDETGNKGFSRAEITGLSRAYGGLVQQGERVAPGIPLGAERPGLMYKRHSLIATDAASPWHGRVLPDARGLIVSRLILENWFRYVLFEVDDPALDWRQLDLDTALPKLEVKAPMLSGRSTDLGEFHRRGGKLLLYSGWGDVGVNPYFIRDYYEEMMKVSGESTQDFARLFLVPGMFHCKGGYNVDRFDTMTTLINWVEGGQAPDQLIGKRMKGNTVTRTRPICAYPQVATYRGRGSTDRAENFHCRTP